MLDNLRQMNRLSDAEERRIENRIRIIIFALALAVVIFVVMQGLKGVKLGPFYYGIMLTLLAVIWILQDVVGTVLKHALAQRTDEQVNAYLKACGLDLLSYVGLAWFLVAMNSNSIIGAAIYVVGITSSRKQRDIYYKEPGEEEESNIVEGEGRVVDSGDDTASKDNEPASFESLPTAADRQFREQQAQPEEAVEVNTQTQPEEPVEVNTQAQPEEAAQAQKETEDGSV